MSPYKHRNNQSIDTSNEEWSEILTVDIEESISGRLSAEASSTTVRLAPADPSPVEVDVNKALSAQDLKSLKKRDPFLYYSIPGVRDATVRQKRVDMHQLAQDALRRNCASCPASIQTATDSVAKVKRCTRVSFECPADVLLEDLFESQMMEIEKSSLAESRVEEFLAKLGL